MIALFAALALQSALQQEAPALLEQASFRVFDAHRDLAFTLGRCSAVLPTAGSLPSVDEVNAEIAAIDAPALNRGLARIHAVAYAEGLQAVDQGDLTPAGCADAIDEAAGHHVQVTRGLGGLIETLDRDGRQ